MDREEMERQLVQLKKENARLRQEKEQQQGKRARQRNSPRVKNEMEVDEGLPTPRGDIIRDASSRRTDRKRGNQSDTSSYKQPELGARTRALLESNEGRTIWVGGDDTSKSVSFSIVGAALPDARQTFPVHLFSKNDANTNTAAKAVAIAYGKLEARGTYIGAEISFRDSRNELTFKIVQLEQPSDPSEHEIFTVASKTDYRVLAGAVAKNLRDNKDIRLRAIGKTAVYTAARSVACAGEYLANEDQDFICVPFFTKVQLDNVRAESTCVEFGIFNMTE